MSRSRYKILEARTRNFSYSYKALKDIEEPLKFKATILPHRTRSQNKLKVNHPAPSRSFPMTDDSACVNGTPRFSISESHPAQQQQTHAENLSTDLYNTKLQSLVKHLELRQLLETHQSMQTHSHHYPISIQELERRILTKNLEIDTLDHHQRGLDILMLRKAEQICQSSSSSASSSLVSLNSQSSDTSASIPTSSSFIDLSQENDNDNSASSANVPKTPTIVKLANYSYYYCSDPDRDREDEPNQLRLDSANTRTRRMLQREAFSLTQQISELESQRDHILSGMQEEQESVLRSLDAAFQSVDQE